MNDYDFEAQNAEDRAWARRQKMEAQSALTKRMIVATSGFDAAWKRWRDGRQHVQALREGYIKPKKHFEVDWNKVAYSALCQIVNIAITLACIFNGNYFVGPIVFVLLLGLNYLMLISDKDN